jgi:hypothetical protein
MSATAKRKPLASVAMHDSEDINIYSGLDRAIRSYVSRGILQLYGLTLIEFLELPMDVVETLYTIAAEEQSRKSSTLSDVERQFSKL